MDSHVDRATAVGLWKCVLVVPSKQPTLGALPVGTDTSELGEIQGAVCQMVADAHAAIPCVESGHQLTAFIRSVADRGYLDLMRRRIRVAEGVTEYGRLIQGAPKTRESRRWVSVPESVAFEIAEHLRLYPVGENGLLLTAPQGGPIRRPHFGAAWREARKAVSLDDLPFRNLRHTGATMLLDEGYDSLAVARRLGHTSTRMVERHYAGRLRNVDKEMADRLGVLRDRPSGDRQRTAQEPEPEAR
jgi:hypothetical protein